jgi:hypothetical protein
MSEIFATIRLEIGAGNLEESIELAIGFLRDRHPDLCDECVQHQGKLNECNRHMRLGLLRQDDVDLTRSRIRFALLEIIKQLERAPEPVAATAPKPVLLARPTPAPAPAPTPPAEDDADEYAQRGAVLIREFFDALAALPQPAPAATALLHGSLLTGGQVNAQFRDYNLLPACQRLGQYRRPAEIVQVRDTRRTAIGTLAQREEGREYMFTVARIQDNGSMPGTIRVFFPAAGGPARITALSL